MIALRGRRGIVIPIAEITPEHMRAVNARLDSIRDEVDEEPMEACS